MEVVILEPFKVVVDYAVTPDALEQLYRAIKELFSPKRLIAVLGSCGGGRDKWKRPVFGEIAAKHCQEIIITNEDPYDEDPMAIINQIAEKAGSGARKILDRREAIKQALLSAQPGDAVVVSGKGCEPWIMEAHGKKTPWDDRRAVREEYEKLRGSLK